MLSFLSSHGNKTPSSHGNKTPRIKDSKHSFGANSASSPYSPHIEGQGEKRLLVGLLPRCDVPGRCPQPSQKLFKRSNQISPWLNLSHVLFAASSCSQTRCLSVCTAINELPGQLLQHWASVKVWGANVGWSAINIDLSVSETAAFRGWCWTPKWWPNYCGVKHWAEC